MRHASHLKKLYIEGFLLATKDKTNLADLAAAILEAQEEVNMESLTLQYIGAEVDGVVEIPAEAKRLINALIDSGITQLTGLNLSHNYGWLARYGNGEAG